MRLRGVTALPKTSLIKFLEGDELKNKIKTIRESPPGGTWRILIIGQTPLENPKAVYVTPRYVFFESNEIPRAIEALRAELKTFLTEKPIRVVFDLRDCTPEMMEKVFLDPLCNFGKELKEHGSEVGLLISGPSNSHDLARQTLADVFLDTKSRRWQGLRGKLSESGIFNTHISEERLLASLFKG